MRLKHIKGSEEIISKSSIVIHNPYDYKSRWNELFDNKNKIYLEIGIGKGSFLLKHALLNPNKNYIGIEKYPSVLLNVVNSIEEKQLKNIRIVCIDASEINRIFYKEISKLFLNFSDPWPKKRHTKRRLTSDVFLAKYEKIFKGIKVIEQKTDNDDLFNYSIEQYKLHNYHILKCNRNYFASIKTEYEEKFISKGKNIKFVKVYKI